MPSHTHTHTHSLSLSLSLCGKGMRAFKAAATAVAFTNDLVKLEDESLTDKDVEVMKRRNPGKQFVRRNSRGSWSYA